MPSSASENYLHRCLARHGELTELLYRRHQDLAAVEKAASGIRSGRKLDYEAIQTIVDPTLWDGSEFWRWPSREAIEADLSAHGWDFWNLPKNEQRVIGRLIELFRFIEPVSVILRFVAPLDYGIFSAPVAKVLEVRRGSSLAQTYSNYLADLRELRDANEFRSAAEVDMALWVLQKGVLDGLLPDRAALVEESETDTHLRDIRVRNLSKALFDDFTRVQLADALRTVDRRLAAQIAGIEFEEMVKEKAGASSEQDLAVVIESLHGEGRIDSVTKGYWHRARITRNKALHDHVRLDERSVSDLIDEITTPRPVRGSRGSR